MRLGGSLHCLPPVLVGLAVSTLVNRSVWRDLVAVRLAKVRASLVLLVARSSRPSLAQVARYSSPLLGGANCVRSKMRIPYNPELCSRSIIDNPRHLE